MTRRIFVLLALAVGWVYGRADAVEPLPAGHYPAVLICPKLAEDSAGHVKLVRYGDGEMITYRCLRSGY